MANKLFQAFIDTAKTIAGYPITVANAVFMRDGSTLDEFSENIPHREDDEDTNIEVPNIDADMLNGHPADYYSKQSDLSALNNSVTQINNKIGNTDISKWGNSLTGAIKSACEKADANEVSIADVNSNLIEIQTVSGTLNSDDSWLNVSLPSGFTSQNSVVVGIKVFWYSDLFISTQYLSGKEKYECYYSSLNSFSIRGLDSDTQGKTFYISFMKLKN
mgnify:CR=1 FL=1